MMLSSIRVPRFRTGHRKIDKALDSLKSGEARMKNSFKLKAITAAIMASCIASAAYAAEETTEVNSVNQKRVAENTQNEIETIEITGFKGSLQKALNSKRFSQNVSDSIHAEDVGKSTDQNIADALSRVTGVTVTESDGEGARISIRGAGPSLNQISINGIALTGGLSDPSGNSGQDNSVDLSTFSADILSSIDVVKTAAADQDEGSLGGSVSLNTVKPLNLNKNRRSFTLEGRYNEFSDENDIRFNGSFSQKFLDDTFGVVVTLSHDNQKTRQDRITTDYVNGVLPLVDWEAASGRKATDLNGKQIRVLGYTTDDDGNRTLNSEDSLTNYDPANQVVISEDEAWATAREVIRLGLNRNERERTSINAGFQYQPSDNLDIQLDLTHTQQKRWEDNHSLTMNLSPVGQLQADTDVNVVNLATNTIDQMYGRSFTGGFNRTAGLRELETNVATLSLKYYITDDLEMDLTAGYSKTTDETPDQSSPDAYISMNTATWGTAGREAVMGMPNYENVGYDCTQGNGEDCQYSVGTTVGVFDAFDGTAIDVRSRFNPYDLHHNHLGGFTFRNNKQEDENKSLFVDFDYTLDYEHFRSIEFGVKYAKRVKDVLVQNVRIENSNDVPDLEDLGNTEPPRGMGTINVGDILSGEQFPYDNFAEDIQSDRSSPIFAGWPMLSVDKALDLILAGEDLKTQEDPRGSRHLETETKAAYLKLNFEAMDGKLTGNFGVRYIKDDNLGRGLGSIQYIKNQQIIDPYELLVERNLGDMTQDACPDAEVGTYLGNSDWRGTPLNQDQLSDCWAWQVTHAYTRNNSATYPYDNDTDTWLIAGPDGVAQEDVNRVLWMNSDGTIQRTEPLPAQVYTNTAGVTVPTNAGLWVRFGQPASAPIWPFISRVTSTLTDQPGEPYDVYGDQVWRRFASVQNTGSNEAILPSLTLNYAINNEMILRFATSKTITRPNMDSMNPRVEITENQWGTSTGRAGNTQLEFLESTNLDLSFEWYFDDTGLLSVALFNKDMENFEEQVETPYHYKDVKSEYELESADLLLNFDENRVPGDADQCHTHRYPAGWMDEWTIECDVVLVNVIKNGKGSNITGLELGYTQNYDFLPGILSGLGASINYTYQTSERDPQEVGTTGVFLESLPIANTPEHSANGTIFWEKDGINLRLANRYTGVQLINSGLSGGATWQDETNRLDFSASYKLTQNLSLTFNALNLTDDDRRLFYTIKNATDATNANDQTIHVNEGNYFDNSSAISTRTAAAFKTGRQYRIGIRGSF